MGVTLQVLQMKLVCSSPTKQKEEAEEGNGQLRLVSSIDLKFPLYGLFLIELFYFYFIENVDKNDQLGVQKADVKSKHKKINSEMCTRRWRDVTAEERQRTIYAADMFRTDNPFCKVILRPSYVYRGFLLVSP